MYNTLMNLSVDLKSAVDMMSSEISKVLLKNNPSIYLYGSVVLNDFQRGWSDIDLLVLTEKPISLDQGEKLVNLRQNLVQREGNS